MFFLIKAGQWLEDCLVGKEQRKRATRHAARDLSGIMKNRHAIGNEKKKGTEKEEKNK